MRVDQRPFESHKLEGPGATPGPATDLVIDGRVRKLAKRADRESADFAGSTPASVTLRFNPVVQRRRRLGDNQESAGSIPAGIT